MTRRDPNQMTLFEHLEELRTRIFRSLLVWIVVFALCLSFSRDLFDLLAQPFYHAPHGPGSFGAIDPKEPFFAHIKASFWVSLILGSGIFFFHFWSFVSPGLTKGERKAAIPFFIFMAIFFVSGCFFCFFQVFPSVIDFLLSWNEGGLSSYTRSHYLSLLFAMVLGMGVCFEIPVVIFVLGRFNIVSPRFLMAKFKWAVLLAFVLAAIITPTPDVMTQTLFAGPMVLLYLLGVGAAWLVTPGRREAENQAEADGGS